MLLTTLKVSSTLSKPIAKLHLWQSKPLIKPVLWLWSTARAFLSSD